MILSNTKLDVDFVKSQFPAFNDPLCKDWSFFENAGGSYVPKTVIDRLSNFMTSTKVQPYAEYPMSKIAGEEMDKAIKLFASIINAKENEIIIGGSTSINLYVLSNALKKILKAGSIFHFPPGAVHQEEALSNCIIVEASTPHFNDRVRVEKKYGIFYNKGLPTTLKKEIAFK